VTRIVETWARCDSSYNGSNVSKETPNEHTKQKDKAWISSRGNNDCTDRTGCKRPGNSK